MWSESFSPWQAAGFGLTITWLDQDGVEGGSRVAQFLRGNPAVGRIRAIPVAVNPNF